MIGKDTQAWVGALANLTARGNVTISATSSEKILSISAGVGGGGSAAVTVNAGISIIGVTTRAYIDDGAAVDADGSVKVAASESMDLDVISGNVSISRLGERRGRGGDPDRHQDDGGLRGRRRRRQRAWPGRRHRRRHRRLHRHASTRRASSPRTPSTGNTIELGYAHGLSDGDQVVYYSGGGTPIGGLEDGGVYYVDVVSPTAIQLQTKLKPITLSGPRTQWLVERVLNAEAVEVDGLSRTFDSAKVSGDAITIAGHGFSNDDKVVYDAGSHPALTGLVDGGTYYVIVVNANTIKLAAAPGGGAIGLGHVTQTQSLTKRVPDSDGFDQNSGPAKTFNAVTVSGDTLTITGHGLATGDKVRYDSGAFGNLPGLTDGGDYFVIFVDANHVKLALSPQDTAAATIALNPGVATGRAHRIVPATSAGIPGHGLEGVLASGRRDREHHQAAVHARPRRREQHEPARHRRRRGLPHRRRRGDRRPRGRQDLLRDRRRLVLARHLPRDDEGQRAGQHRHRARQEPRHGRGPQHRARRRRARSRTRPTCSG